MHSVSDNAHVVSDYLEAEKSRGAVLGAFASDDVPGVYINQFGITPKSHQSGNGGK